MEKHLIRTEIMNLSLFQWRKVKEIEKCGFVELTVKEFYDEELKNFGFVEFDTFINEIPNLLQIHEDSLKFQRRDKEKSKPSSTYSTYFYYSKVISLLQFFTFKII